MAKLVYTQKTLPTREAFRQQLAQAMAQSSPLDEFEELAIQLRALERQKGITSEIFYEQYQQGQIGDDEQTVQWAILYRAYLELKKRLELALMRQAVWTDTALAT
jgi:hypothetical protein